VSDAQPLRSELAAGVLTLTLDRPDKRNALGSVLVDALHAAIDAADLDAAVRVIVLRGAGSDFCAGADLSELLASADRTLAQNEAEALRLGSLFSRLRSLPMPVVAVVQGRALAGGAGLALAADLVLADEEAQIGFPEIQRGFVPAMVMTLLRRAAGEKPAFDLVATGRLLSAREACNLGLVSRVCSGGRLAEESGAVTAGLAGADPSALALTKRLFYELDGTALAEGIALGAKVNAAARSTSGFRKAIGAFLGR
jgi:methylglutaconyl-CoA hydratase